jgi:tetratricopeptide (TPR) repeat protein
MYGKENIVKGWGICENCGIYGPNTSYSARQWGHIYFIPIIPSHYRVRVVKECKKCSRGVHIREKQAADLLDEVYKDTKSALAAIIKGEKEFDDGNEKIPAVAYLANTTETLYCLNAVDHIQLILGVLQEKRQEHAYHLVRGEALEFLGKLDKATDEYTKAIECDPEDALALMSLGTVCKKKNDLQSARKLYEKALELSNDKIYAYQELLTIYTNLKEHARVAETYEKCFEIVPGLKSDKKVWKAYRKACKKAGKMPVIR